MPCDYARGAYAAARPALSCHAVVTRGVVGNRREGVVRFGGGRRGSGCYRILQSTKSSEEVMRTVCAVLLVFSIVPVLHACPKREQDKLVRQDGDDVLVSTSVSSSGPGQMVMKSHEIDAKNRV